MLTKIEVINVRGENLALPLETSISGYLVKGVDGLDPVKASVASTPFGQQDGEVIQAARRGSRNIVLRLGLEADYVTKTVQGLRKHLYRFFMPKSEVKFRFYIDDTPYAEISGIVESMESPLFTDKPEAIISVLCFSPDLVSADPIVLSWTSDNGHQSPVTIDYDGDVPTGVVFKLDLPRFTPPISGVGVRNITPSGLIQGFSITKVLTTPDSLEMSSIPGDKYIRQVNPQTGGQSLLDLANGDSIWIQLYPGPNRFSVATPIVDLPYTITYNNLYGGL